MSKLNNFMDWDNPGTAFITGASSGIGAAFARELANQNFSIILVARRKEKLEALASELKENQEITVQILVADLSKLKEIESIYSDITKLGDIDVLINNAGFGTRGYFDSIPFGPQRDMLFVHNVAPVYFSRATLPIMIKRGRGVIINVSSLAAFTYWPQNVIYSSTKTFLKVFTEILNMELNDTGVKVQALCPGFTITEFHEVGDFKDFDRSLVPESAWMPAKKVVKLSLKAVSEDKVVFIPGKHNQAFIKLYTDPKLGQRTRKNMIKASKIPRKKE